MSPGNLQVSVSRLVGIPTSRYIHESGSPMGADPGRSGYLLMYLAATCILLYLYNIINTPHLAKFIEAN